MISVFPLSFCPCVFHHRFRAPAHVALSYQQPKGQAIRSWDIFNGRLLPAFATTFFWKMFVFKPDETYGCNMTMLHLTLMYKSHTTWIGAMETIWFIMEVYTSGHPIHQQSQIQDEVLQHITDDAALRWNNHESNMCCLKWADLCTANTGNFKQKVMYVCTLHHNVPYTCSIQFLCS